MAHRDQYSSEEEAVGGVDAAACKHESPGMLWGGDADSDHHAKRAAWFDPSRHAGWFAAYWAEPYDCAGTAVTEKASRTTAREISPIPA